MCSMYGSNQPHAPSIGVINLRRNQLHAPSIGAIDLERNQPHAPSIGVIDRVFHLRDFHLRDLTNSVELAVCGVVFAMRGRSCLLCIWGDA